MNYGTKKTTGSKAVNVDKFTPEEIKAHLDKYVIGQEQAKKVLSVAVYNHYKKLSKNMSHSGNVELEKSNVILLGSTGCGKTLMVQTIAKLLDVPYYIQDCTKITASGYVGSDVEDCLVGLLRNSNYNLERAEMGIVMLDEGDKIAKKDAGPSITRDVSGECVQQSLLKIVEGDTVGVPPMGGRKHPEQSLLYVDTKNILFILSGAFVGLDDIIKKRFTGNSIGFNSDNMKSSEIKCFEEFATPQDIRDFGMIPEFVGRFPVITHVEPLEKSDLVRILTEPDNAIIKQYQELLGYDNVKLEFTPDALDEIAGLAVSMNTGARGLRTIMETIMTDVMFEAPSLGKNSRTKSKVVIDREFVKDKTERKFRNTRGLTGVAS